MKLEDFSIFLREKDLISANEHIKNALQLRNRCDDKNCLNELRDAIEAIRTKIFEENNLDREKTLLKDLISLLSRGKNNYKIIDDSKIPESDKVNKKQILGNLRSLISLLVSITNIASHDNPKPSTFEANTSLFALRLASSIFPYLFYLFKPNIEKPKIKKLGDISEFLPIIEESKEYEDEPDSFKILFTIDHQIRDEQINDILIDIHSFERDFVSQLDKREYSLAKDSIEKALMKLNQIERNLENALYGIEARLHLRKGLIYRMKGQEDPEKYDKSIENFEKSLEIAESISDNKIQNYYKIISFISLADAYRVSSRHSLYKSIEYIKKARDLAWFLKRGKYEIIPNFCLGFLYNQYGLINFQKGLNKFKYLEIALKNKIDSVMYFYKSKQRRWIAKSLINLCACLHTTSLTNKNYNLEEIEKIIAFLKEIPEIGDPEHQFKHNLSSIKSKFLLLTFDLQSLQEAENLIKRSVKRSWNSRQLRTLGAELIILGEIYLLQRNNIYKGRFFLKKGAKLLKDHEQVRSTALYEWRRFVDIMIESDRFNSEDILKLENIFN